METFLKFAVENRASDVFITAGKLPSFRIMGEVTSLDPAQNQPVSSEEVTAFRRRILGNLEEKYRVSGSLDASCALDSGERFRLNFFETLSGPAFAARPIRSGDRQNFETLGLPEAVMEKIVSASRGIIVVAGTTGSGKSTTLSAIVNYINAHCRKHILMLEDPIEFVHSDKNSVISQREIATAETGGFAYALRAALRENPDVIVIGELRDVETLETALTAALTGHLVITTLHTTNAVQTLERMVNYFPEGRKESIAADFAMTLEAVIVQRLLPRCDGSGMVPALEIMRRSAMVSKQIADCNYLALEESIRAGGADGMNTFNQALFRLNQEGIVSRDDAMQCSDNPDELALMFKGMQSESDTFAQRYAFASGGAKTLIDMKALLRAAVRHSASDLLLTCGAPPMLRINGEYCPLQLPQLSADDMRHLLGSIINRRQRIIWEEKKELDFAISATLPAADRSKPDESRRFRVNAFFQRGVPGLVARVISNCIPTPVELGLPAILPHLMQKKQGLILITGPTGSGKSTTLASLVNMIGTVKPLHIITIEDPIEYVYDNGVAVFEQRELGIDTFSFANGLRAAMREAPDIILVGEMRDTETIAAALTAAETGHLVLGTIHTNSVTQTVDRIIDSFAADKQNQVRQQLAATILGVVSQRLLVRADGKGRIGAFEIMVGTPPVQALIRENKTHMLQSTIETAAKDGMVTMARALEELYAAKLIRKSDLALFEADHHLSEL